MRRVGRQRKKGSEGVGVVVMVFEKELLMNGYREEIGLHMIDTEHRKKL